MIWIFNKSCKNTLYLDKDILDRANLIYGALKWETKAGIGNAAFDF